MTGLPRGTEWAGWAASGCLAAMLLATAAAAALRMAPVEPLGEEPQPAVLDLAIGVAMPPSSTPPAPQVDAPAPPLKAPDTTRPEAPRPVVQKAPAPRPPAPAAPSMPDMPAPPGIGSLPLPPPPPEPPPPRAEPPKPPAIAQAEPPPPKPEPVPEPEVEQPKPKDPAPKAAKKEPPKKAKPKPKPTEQAEASPKAKSAESAPAGATASPAQPKKAQNKGGGTNAAQYPKLVLKKIARLKRKASPARGTVVVGFEIAADGGLRRVAVVASSGSAALDAVAADHIRRAAPFPPPPEGAQRRFSFEFVGK
jgi:protein TonB